MTRRWVWLQLLIGWTPVWALFVTLILTGHPGTSLAAAVLIGLRMIAAAVVLGLLVQRLTQRFPWPHPVRPGFVLLHVGAALAFAASWIVLNSLLESLHARALVFVFGPGLGPFLVLGVWLYVMVAGVTYASQAAERAARIEAAAARSQLAALRAQLHPHFLFNALHTVVQLIPGQPQQAAQAAEQIAALLRTVIEEDRDLVTLAEEWKFVERYLAIERIRFGDRLDVDTDFDDDARSSPVPCFALQTLVENAVRHGAAPRVEPTRVRISGHTANGRLTVVVQDDGAGASAAALQATSGTGLARLRDRLAALFGDEARLDVETAPGVGFQATLVMPRRTDGGAEGRAAGSAARRPRHAAEESRRIS